MSSLLCFLCWKPGGFTRTGTGCQAQSWREDPDLKILGLRHSGAAALEGYRSNPLCLGVPTRRTESSHCVPEVGTIERLSKTSREHPKPWRSPATGGLDPPSPPIGRRPAGGHGSPNMWVSEDRSFSSPPGYYEVYPK